MPPQRYADDCCYATYYGDISYALLRHIADTMLRHVYYTLLLHTHTP